MFVFGIPLDFFLFGFTLLAVAVFHHHTLKVAVTGLIAIALFKLALGDFAGTPGVAGLLQLLKHEWVTLANLLGLLLGFALLADHFEKTGIPAILPNYHRACRSTRRQCLCVAAFLQARRVPAERA